VVVAELRYGADRSERHGENHKRLDILTAEIQCLDFDLAAAWVYGQIRSTLEAEGAPIGPYDMMIAAHAVSRGLVLVTGDRQREGVFGGSPGCRSRPGYCSWRA
jgi:tRNA(fMet)-specific endonuclease VapC